MYVRACMCMCVCVCGFLMALHPRLGADSYVNYLDENGEYVCMCVRVCVCVCVCVWVSDGTAPAVRR